MFPPSRDSKNSDKEIAVKQEIIAKTKLDHVTLPSNVSRLNESKEKGENNIQQPKTHIKEVRDKVGNEKDVNKKEFVAEKPKASAEPIQKTAEGSFAQSKLNASHLQPPGMLKDVPKTHLGVSAIQDARDAKENASDPILVHGFAHLGFRKALAKLDDQAGLETLSKEVAELLPDSTRRQAGKIKSDKLEAYRKDPLKNYLEATISERRIFDRLLMVETLEKGLMVAVVNHPDKFDSLMKTAQNSIPEEPEIANVIRDRGRLKLVETSGKLYFDESPTPKKSDMPMPLPGSDIFNSKEYIQSEIEQQNRRLVSLEVLRKSKAIRGNIGKEEMDKPTYEAINNDEKATKDLIKTLESRLKKTIYER